MISHFILYGGESRYESLLAYIGSSQPLALEKFYWQASTCRFLFIYRMDTDIYASDWRRSIIIIYLMLLDIDGYIS